MMKALVFGIALMTMSPGLSGQGKPVGSLNDVTGVWIMLIEGHQVGLELEQTGAPWRA